MTRSPGAIGDVPRWGVWLEPMLPVPELAALARRAEEAGASHVFIADEGTDRDVHVVMAAIALATRQIRIGAGITNPFTRHPVATAAAFASLEELAPGRIIAGYGVGGSRVLGPIGLRPPRPFTALRELVDAADRLLDRQEVTHAGVATLSRARLPWSPRRLPFAMAGRGPRVQAYAIEHADWLLLAGKPLHDLPRLVEDIRLRSEAAAGHAARIAWSTYLAWTPAMIEDVRPHFTYATVDMPAATRERLGVSEAAAARIREVMLADGMAAAARLVPTSVLLGCAVVGDREAVVARLAEVRRTVSPELFVLAINDYAAAAELIDAAAPLIREAGYADAGELGPDPARTRPFDDPSESSIDPQEDPHALAAHRS